MPRAFPIYNKKTFKSAASQKRILIWFLFVGENTDALDQSEVDCLNAAGQSVRLTAKIVDAPCNDMNTSHFVEVFMFSDTCR